MEGVEAATTTENAPHQDSHPVDASLAIQRRYTTNDTEATVGRALEGVPEDKRNVACLLCPFVATCLNRLRIHVRQHFVNHVCACGDMSYRRDAVLKHIAKEKSGSHFGSKGCVDRLVYEVDESSFAEFKAATGNPAVEFLPLKPLGETPTDPQAAADGRDPTGNPPSGSDPGDNRRGEERSPDAAEPSPAISCVQGEQKTAPASAAVRLPLSRRARKEQHRLEREERKEKQRLERQADRARHPSRAAPLAASSVDMARQPAAKRKERDESVHLKSSKKDKPERSSAKKHRPSSTHSAPPTETAQSDLRVKLHRLQQALHTVDRSALPPQAKAASATPASSTSAAVDPFPPLPASTPAPRETFATMTSQERRVLEQPTIRIPLDLNPRTLPRVAPPVFVEKILRVEAELQDFYRWMVENHPNEEVETRLELVTLQLGDARRHALRPADRASAALTTALTNDLRLLQTRQAQQAALLRGRPSTPTPWTAPEAPE